MKYENSSVFILFLPWKPFLSSFSEGFSIFIISIKKTKIYEYKCILLHNFIC